MQPASRDTLFGALRDSAIEVYADRLRSLAVFGSWARGAATPSSDLDVLVVAEPLPPSRMKRVREFVAVSEAIREARRHVWSGAGPEVRVSPVLKTPAELSAGSPLYLDMTLWVAILHDRNGLLTQYLDGLRERMRKLGSRRVAYKGGAYWDYKPTISPGEVVEL